MSAQKLPGEHGPFAQGVLGQTAHDVEFTVGAQATDTITVAVQLKDENGANLSSVACVKAFLTTTSAGTVFATAPATSTLVGANGGVMAETVATFSDITLLTNATGRVDVALTDDTTRNAYLNVVLPNGVIKRSPVIAWVA